MYISLVFSYRITINVSMYVTPIQLATIQKQNYIQNKNKSCSNLLTFRIIYILYTSDCMVHINSDRYLVTGANLSYPNLDPVTE